MNLRVTAPRQSTYLRVSTPRIPIYLRVSTSGQPTIRVTSNNPTNTIRVSTGRPTVHLTVKGIVNQGPQGPPGGVLINPYIAGENLSTGRAVIKSVNKIYYFNPEDVTHVGRAMGITVTSGLTNESVNVQMNGAVTDASFSFTADQPIYVTTGGVLVNTIPPTTLLQRAGLAISTNSILIEFNTAIIRT